MKEQDLKIFENIKEKFEKDKLQWNRAQENESIYISPEQEDEFIERMFLVYYTEQYIILEKKVEELEEKLIKKEIQQERQWNRVNLH